MTGEQFDSLSWGEVLLVEWEAWGREGNSRSSLGEA